MDERTAYCFNCARPAADRGQHCRHCGAPVPGPRMARVAGVRFLLGELDRRPLLDVLTVQQRARIGAEYERELSAFFAPPAGEHGAAASPVPSPAVAGGAPSITAPAPVTARRMPPPRPPAPPRQPMDWGWLVEQQANLFLFAGAFLTVVAALIYVGYSGQAVDGALKMALLVVYTCAFLAGGALCLRIERVKMAGQVFFAIGAVLVPMNFATARSILSDESLNPVTMWLAGSIVTAAFYTAVASLGAGRAYSFGGGVALVSGMLAAVVRADVGPEWAPALFIALAIGMSLAGVASPKQLRERVGSIWYAQSQAVALTSIAVAIFIAPYASGDHQMTRAFLPIAFAGFAVYAGIAMLVRRRIEAAVAAIAGCAGAFVSLVYATHAPAEDYAVAAGALALLLGAVALAVARESLKSRLPVELDDALRYAALAASGAAALAALLVVTAAAGENGTYAVENRWFLATSFALLTAYFAIDATVRRRPEGLAGACLALGGLAAGVTYGWDAPGEQYVVAFTALAVGFGLAAIMSKRELVAKRLPDDTTVYLRAAGIGATVLAATIAALLLANAAGENPQYAVASRWFLLTASALAFAFYALDALSLRNRSGLIGMAIALAKIGVSVAYGLHLGAEYYAIALASSALFVALTNGVAQVAGERRVLPDGAGIVLHWMTLAIGIAAGAVAGGALLAAAGDAPSYVFDTRWSIVVVMACIFAAAIVDSFAVRREEGPLSAAVALAALGAAAVYALDVSAEYYAFGLIVPAIALAALGRFASHRSFDRLHAAWRPDVIAIAGASTLLGVSIAIIAAVAGSDPNATFRPEGHVFLPVAFALAGVCFAIDASRRLRVESSLATLLAIAGAIISVPYALGLGAVYYACSLAATGMLFAFAGRVWTPGWIDTRIRDALAATAITAAWLPFEGVFLREARIGAAIHFAAASFYGAAAFTSRDGISLGGVLDLPATTRARAAAVWLYAAGLTLTLGYLHVLNALPGGQTLEDSLRLAYPMFAAAIAFAAAGVAIRYIHPDMRIHLYVMALAAALVSLAAPADATTFAIVLTAYTAISVALAVFEDAPPLGIPGAIFGFAAIVAWRQQSDAPAYALPVAYSLAAVALAGAGATARRRARWADALGAAAAVYALAAPAVGFGILSDVSRGGSVDGTPFQETALYQWSTVSVAIAGALTIGGGLLAARRWVIVPGSAMVASALLLEVGRFNPQDAQPYALIAGGYVLLLGLLGISKFGLIPAWKDTAPVIEAMGAAIIMFPTMVQALEIGWQYELLLLIEAAALFTAAIALRRQGILLVAALALVAVAGRALFDAVNALPNWVVVMTAGMALLGIGMAILAGRDRWSRWQEALIGWWDANHQPA